MDTTVGKLIELLSHYDKNKIVTNQLNESFIHICNNSDGSVILSTEKPIGHCNVCGEYVYPEHPELVAQGYTGYCPQCDESKYKIEIEALCQGN